MSGAPSETAGRTGGSCTIIIPAHNESAVIAGTIRTIQSATTGSAREWRLIVVDDGSTDGTAETAKAALNDAGSVIRKDRCEGKAMAIVTGIEACRTERLLFTDADLSVPVSFFKPFAAALDDRDVVIASRRLPGSVIERHQPWIRETCGEIFRRMVRMAFMPDVSDFTCGLKAFRTDVARELFRDLLCRDWTFDVEVILRAKRAGRHLHEIPVRWTNRADSRVRVASAIVRSMGSLIRLKLKYASIAGRRGSA